MEAYGIRRHGRNCGVAFGRNQECATGSASALFCDPKKVIANFRWTALAEPNTVRQIYCGGADARLLRVPLARPVPSSVVRRRTLAKPVPHMHNT